MKDVEFRLLSELVKNSRRNDKQLARKVGTSQPTINRAIRKLEKEGLIKEYTIIPDFCKLGYEILAFTFLKHNDQLSLEDYKKLREEALELEKKSASSTIIIMNGTGLEASRVIVSFHADYTTFANYVKRMKRLSKYYISYIDSFLVNLSDATSPRSMTFSFLAEHLMKLKGKNRKIGEKLTSDSTS
jgi:DNA-binding Lrp family transcriptional regulator